MSELSAVCLFVCLCEFVQSTVYSLFIQKCTICTADSIQSVQSKVYISVLELVVFVLFVIALVVFCTVKSFSSRLLFVCLSFRLDASVILFV